MVERQDENSTIFGKILRGEVPAERVYEDEHCVAFRDINAAAPTHVLVIPRRRIVDLFEAGPEDAELLGRLLLATAEVARQQGLEKGGYRLVINNGAGVGQSVFHIHLHVLGGRGFSWPPG